MKTMNQTSKTQKSLKPYQAFDTAGKSVPYMEIRCVLQPSQSPQSRFLMATVFSADGDEAFTLIYSFMAVEIKGQNLKVIRNTIQQGRCGFIQEYHETAFAQPPKDVPVIESIRFITGDKLNDILSSYKGA
jgi:hypothetical protein